MEATLRSRVDMADLQRAQAKSTLEAKAQEIAQVSERIPFLETSVA